MTTPARLLLTPLALAAFFALAFVWLIVGEGEDEVENRPEWVVNCPDWVQVSDE